MPLWSGIWRQLATVAAHYTGSVVLSSRPWTAGTVLCRPWRGWQACQHHRTYSTDWSVLMCCTYVWVAPLPRTFHRVRQDTWRAPCLGPTSSSLTALSVSRFSFNSSILMLVSCTVSLPLTICFVALQVLDLGVTRDLGHRLVEKFPAMCAGSTPFAGSPAATYRLAFERLFHLGRRSKACKAPPGYVFASSQGYSPTTRERGLLATMAVRLRGTL